MDDDMKPKSTLAERREIVGPLVGEWLALRAVLAEVERAEHPDITDRFGRVWTWKSGDLYTHDETLAFPEAFVRDPRLGLPLWTCAKNPNYAGLCAICRSQWPSELVEPARRQQYEDESYGETGAPVVWDEATTADFMTWWQIGYGGK